VLAGVSFVGGSWRTDSCGHGTFVAGEIAANPVNGVGIAGIAFNAELLVAKVVQSDCNVSTMGEVRAITWAVNHGARIINLSIGGNRDPATRIDSFRRPRRRRSSTRGRRLWLPPSGTATGEDTGGADYPAALHVMGVAVTQRLSSLLELRQAVRRHGPGG
jgi:subtilisin family serine protease